MISTQRHLFDVPQDVAYFNCAYNAPQLNASRERLVAGAHFKSHPWERTAANFFDDAERVRVLAAELFGGDADGWAVVPAASYGMSAAARAVEPTLGAGDEILVLAEAFPSNYLPWERVARERGARLRVVSTPADGDWTAAILDQLDEGVKVVAVDPCHWTNGAYIDLQAVAMASRAIGAVLAVDATQALGAMPMSIDAIEPDFLVAAGYKWLLCPYGFGLLYVGPRWREARPLEESWLARDNARDFAALVRYSSTYQTGARRFEVGEKCTATLLPGAIAALEQLRDWGVAEVATGLAAINRQIAGRLEELGFSLPPPQMRVPHMFGARVPEGYRGTLVAELAGERIFISQRGDAVRFAPHLHVNDADVERLMVALEAALARG